MLDKFFSIIDRLTGKWFDWRQDQAFKDIPDDLKPQFESIEMRQRGFEIAVTSPLLVHLVSDASALLDKYEAKNYVSFDMMPRLDRGKRAIRVTVQWAHGESPAVKAARLEDELTDLRSQIDRLHVSRVGLLLNALQIIKDKAASWEGQDKAPYWNLGDIASAALLKYEKQAPQSFCAIHNLYLEQKDDGLCPDCFDDEIGRWQTAIHDLIVKVTGDSTIDGSGSDGDELAFTLSEIQQAFNIVQESAAAKLSGKVAQLTFYLDEANCTMTDLQRHVEITDKIVNAIAERIKSDPSSPLLTQFAVYAGNYEVLTKRATAFKLAEMKYSSHRSSCRDGCNQDDGTECSKCGELWMERLDAELKLFEVLK